MLRTTVSSEKFTVTRYEPGSRTLANDVSETVFLRSNRGGRTFVPNDSEPIKVRTVQAPERSERDRLSAVTTGSLRSSLRPSNGVGVSARRGSSPHESDTSPTHARVTDEYRGTVSTRSLREGRLLASSGAGVSVWQSDKRPSTSCERGRNRAASRDDLMTSVPVSEEGVSHSRRPGWYRFQSHTEYRWRVR